MVPSKYGPLARSSALSMVEIAYSHEEHHKTRPSFPYPKSALFILVCSIEDLYNPSHPCCFASKLLLYQVALFGNSCEIFTSYQENRLLVLFYINQGLCTQFSVGGLGRLFALVYDNSFRHHQSL